MIKNNFWSLFVLLIVSNSVLFLLPSCNAKQEEAKKANVYYTCSMDPQVVEYKPGKCPICKMDLTPVSIKSNEKKDEVHLSEQQIKLGNIFVDTIRNGSIGDELILTGTLNFDEMKATSISSRTMGRIEKLYFKSLGDKVTKGSPLYDLYSEELNNAKQEYVLAIDRKKTFASETIVDFEALIQSAKNKLLLWGLSENQISELAKNKKVSPITTFYSSSNGYITQLDIREGDYVMEGGLIFKLADLSTLWAEAQIYESQLSLLNNNGEAQVQIPDFEGKKINGKVSFINPEITADTRINLIRVTIPNIGNQLKPGMPAYVILKSPAKKVLSLPIDAVIRDGKGATSWIKTSSNTFKSVMVQTGIESADRIEIKSGLKEGDIVVLKGAYLLNSEYIFKKGVDPMAGHNH